MLDIEVQAPLEAPLTKEKDVSAAVAEVVELQTTLKAINARIASIKTELKSYATKKRLKRYPSVDTAMSEFARGKTPKKDIKGGVAVIPGDKNTLALVSDVAESLDLPPKKVWKYLKKHDQKALFWDLVGVSTTGFVGVFGREEAEDLAGGAPGNQPYHKIEFRTLGVLKEHKK